MLAFSRSPNSEDVVPCCKQVSTADLSLSLAASYIQRVCSSSPSENFNSYNQIMVVPVVPSTLDPPSMTPASIQALVYT